MEREPEENHHAKYGEESQQTLTNLSDTHLNHLCLLGLRYRLLTWIREVLFIQKIYNQRDRHSTDRSGERVMESSYKDIQIIISKSRQICYLLT